MTHPLWKVNERGEAMFYRWHHCNGSPPDPALVRRAEEDIAAGRVWPFPEKSTPPSSPADGGNPTGLES